MTTVMKEVIKFFIVEETAKNIVNRSNILVGENNTEMTECMFCYFIETVKQQAHSMYATCMHVSYLFV